MDFSVATWLDGGHSFGFVRKIFPNAILPFSVLLVGSPARNNPCLLTKTVADRLGYPGDAKLLIVHADDLAVALSQDIASSDALDQGGVTSVSIMLPRPWLTEVADYGKAHPDADLGLHLTLTSQ